MTDESLWSAFYAWYDEITENDQCVMNILAYVV